MSTFTCTSSAAFLKVYLNYLLDVTSSHMP
jgi:hypothetical protein